jgi:protein disulfide-isomerase A6
LKGIVNVGKVDVTESRALGSRFKVKGFPTIKFFHKGNVFDYNGARSKEAFSFFARNGYTEDTGEKVPDVVAVAPKPEVKAAEPTGPTDVVTLTNGNFEHLV